jgi:hypothetical protein
MYHVDTGSCFRNDEADEDIKVIVKKERYTNACFGKVLVHGVTFVY